MFVYLNTYDTFKKNGLPMQIPKLIENMAETRFKKIPKVAR